MSLPAAFASLRRGRDKSAYYRMWHLRQRTGLARPVEPAPGARVPFETALVALGEESGKLDDCLRLLADYFQAEDRMMQKVLRHAAYPMMTALAATFLGPVPLAVAGRTGAWLAATAAGVVFWAAAGGTLLDGVTRHYLRQPRFVLGRLLRALTIAVESGLGLDRAAVLAAEASGGDAVLAWVRRQAARERAGQPLSATFRGCPGVPREAVAAMEVAEASGDYGGTLRKLADLYEAR